MQTRSHERGASLVEFVIVFTFFLLPLTVGGINLCRLVWHMQFLTDTSREAARAAALYSDRFPEADCSDLALIATPILRDPLDTNPGWGLSSVWGGIVTHIPDYNRKFRAGNSSVGAPEASFRMVVAMYSVSGESCLFCVSGLFSNFDLGIVTTSDLREDSSCI